MSASSCLISGCIQPRNTSRGYCRNHYNSTINAATANQVYFSDIQAGFKNLIDILKQSNPSDENKYISSLRGLAERTLETLRNPKELSAADDIYNFNGITFDKSESIYSPIYTGVEEKKQKVSNSSADNSAEFTNNAIVDIQIVNSKQRKGLSIGYSLLERLMNNVKESADLNRGGSGSKSFLSFRRSGTPCGKLGRNNQLIINEDSMKAAAITSLAIIYKDIGEEPPYGFHSIDKSNKGEDGCLHNSNNNGNNNAKQPYLSYYRGEGAPIIHIGLMNKDKKSSLPGGWHEVKHTPFGNRADLNPNNSNLDNNSINNPTFLCFQPNVNIPLKKYQSTQENLICSLESANKEKKDQSELSHVIAAYSRLLACLTACLYSYDINIVLQALECFKRLPNDGIPVLLVNEFIHSLCSAIPLFLTYFTTEAHASTLRFLAYLVKLYAEQISAHSFIRIAEVLFLIRHEAKRYEIGENLLAFIIQQINSIKPCICEAKANPSYSSTSYSSTLCYKCLQSMHKANLQSRPAYCRSLIVESVENVCWVTSIEQDVKLFQRHSLANSIHFRSDTKQIIEKLATIEANFQLKYNENNLTLNNPAEGLKSPISSAQSSSNNSNNNAIDNLLSPNSSYISPNSPPALNRFISTEVSVEIYPRNNLFIPLYNSNLSLDYHNSAESQLQLFSLICCKFMTELSPWNNKKSEGVKRKNHAVKLLQHIIEHASNYFKSTYSSMLLLRRFIVPAVMNCFVSESSAILQGLLRIFSRLFDSYKSQLFVEIGVMVENILLVYLESNYTPIEVKKDIIELFILMLNSPQQSILLYYNYDNSASKPRAVYEKLLTTLSKIAEGDLTKQQLLQANNTVNNLNSNNNKADKDNTTNSAITGTSEAISISQQDSLQRAALKLIVILFNHITQWLGIIGIKRDPSLVNKPFLAENELGVDGSIGPELSPAELKQQKTRDWSNTWSARYDIQKLQNKIRNQALKIAKQDKLKAALQYLKITNATNALPIEMAKFLYTADSLDKSEVGDFLSNGEDKFLTKEEYEALRTAYLSLIDFTGMSFDSALRLFLCDSGFRLPGESQKIDRILESFCKGYCRDNPTIFVDSNSATIMAFALVMLNTDHHDPRLKKTREPMTLEQFITNLRGVNDGKDFNRSFLESQYYNIVNNAIEWQENREQNNENKSASNDNDEKNIYEDNAKLLRKSVEVSVRKALAASKNSAVYMNNYNTTNNTLIVQGMFDLVWYRAIAAITTRSDHYNGSLELLHLCCDGLLYGAIIATVLGLHTERHAFTQQLAKIIYLERNKDSNKSKDIGRRLLAGDHLKQDCECHTNKCYYY
jgi:hypothetical protein